MGHLCIGHTYTGHKYTGHTSIATFATTPAIEMPFVGSAFFVVEQSWRMDCVAVATRFREASVLCFSNPAGPSSRNFAAGQATFARRPGHFYTQVRPLVHPLEPGGAELKKLCCNPATHHII